MEVELDCIDIISDLECLENNLTIGLSDIHSFITLLRRVIILIRQTDFQENEHLRLNTAYEIRKAIASIANRVAAAFPSLRAKIWLGLNQICEDIIVPDDEGFEEMDGIERLEDIDSDDEEMEVDENVEAYVILEMEVD